jgi:hypothetical protein
MNLDSKCQTRHVLHAYLMNVILFQTRNVCTKLDIYVFITTTPFFVIYKAGREPMPYW